jgi:hypothetical protein
VGTFAAKTLTKIVTITGTLVGICHYVYGPVSMADAIFLFLVAALLSSIKPKSTSDKVEIDIPASEMDDGILIRSFNAAG